MKPGSAIAPVHRADRADRADHKDRSDRSDRQDRHNRPRRSDRSWWVASLAALVCALALLGIGVALVFIVAFGTDSCPVAGAGSRCPVSDDYAAGWRLAILALPVGLVSLLVPHRVQWLWVRAPLLFAAVILCAAPIAGFSIGVGHM